MPDYSQYSDADILQAAGLPQQTPAPTSAPSPADPYAHISDADVLKAAGATDKPPAPPQTPQNDSWWREPAMAASNMAKGAVQTWAHMMDAAGTAAGVPAQAEMNLINRATGDAPEKPLTAGVVNNQDKNEAIFRNAGVIDRPDLQPQNLGEKVLAAGSQGVGGALSMGQIDPRALLSAATSANGAQAAHSMFPDSDIAPIIGGLAGGAAPAAAEAIGNSAFNLGRNAFGLYDPSDRADQIIARKLTSDDIQPSDIADKMSQFPDKPLTIADLGGPNTQRLADATLKIPTDASSQGTQFLQNRDLGTGVTDEFDMMRQGGTADRVVADIRKALGSDDAFKTTEQLLAQRSAAAAPAYDKAFQGGSTAPLEQQFQGYFDQASQAESNARQAVAQAQQKLTNAAGAQQTTGNVYGTASANAKASSAQADLDAAQNALSVAQNNKAAVLAKLRQAQTDGTANAPGAVWSPRIQQFLDDPIMQGGIGRGLQIQRLESLARGEPFNPTEYAVTGTDQAGNPVVGSVPNMRLLDAGKRGLDAIIQDNQDPVTGKLTDYGRAVEMVRKSYLGQLDNLNPDYAAARAAYSGPTKSIQAINLGSNIFNTAPEKVSSMLSEMEPADQDMFRLGVQKALIGKVMNTADGANEVKQVFGNPAKRASVAAAFDDPDALTNLSRSLGAESRMFQTKADVLGNSKSVQRIMDQADNGFSLDAAKPVVAAGAHLAANNPLGALMHLAEPAFNSLKARFGEGADATTNNLLAQRLLNPDYAQNQSRLALIQALMNQPTAQPSPTFLPYLNSAAIGGQASRQ